jgi:hypothetical protein
MRRDARRAVTVPSWRWGDIIDPRRGRDLVDGTAADAACPVLTAAVGGNTDD